MTISHKAEAAPAVLGSTAYTAQFFGLSIPDWVGLATILYLAVMTAIAILRYLEKRNGRDRE